MTYRFTATIGRYSVEMSHYHFSAYGENVEPLEISGDILSSADFRDRFGAQLHGAALEARMRRVAVQISIDALGFTW